MKRSRNVLEGRRPRGETGGNKTSLFRPAATAVAAVVTSARKEHNKWRTSK